MVRDGEVEIDGKHASGHIRPEDKVEVASTAALRSTRTWRLRRRLRRTVLFRFLHKGDSVRVGLRPREYLMFKQIETSSLSEVPKQVGRHVISPSWS